MPVLTTIAMICKACRKGWRLKPEDAYESRKYGGKEWSTLRSTLECPDCKRRLTRMPEPGEPTAFGGYWPVSPDLEWMS